ncbi:MAG TPA: SDR family NAD(P)-dependent oxidoreductase [Cellvibrionaceae bacterium]|nr:SDR family NAD(P)-dependent oxidoreductase [Cellvibrionaceae bacterium]HMY38886.1 SDR family NAD(P)-dependent oxidoreductase [Marinagarivorans sp.]HNG59998.1 SDR family NAD(P)-dependent oxidoreductase [Cellvibrionaceae bacterium]
MEGKTLWIIGASAGIGAEVALQLAQAGHFVIVSARDEAALNQLSFRAPTRIKCLPLDLAAPDTFAAVRQELLNITDFLDGIIFCAGVCEYETNLEFNYAQYSKVMQVNFLGLIAVLNMAKPLLKKSTCRAQIGVVSSLATVVAFPRNEMYGASKAALDYFVAALRCDTVHLPVDITWVRPGFVATRLTAKNDFAMPFLMDVPTAAQKIVRGFLNRKRTVIFPYRLYVLLKLMAAFNPLWRSLCAKFLTRTKTW